MSVSLPDRSLTARARTATVEEVGLAIALALTFATGVVDAISYFSLDHVFTANMSGNMALLGIGVATDIWDVAGNIFAFVGFIAGSIFVGRFLRLHSGSLLHKVRESLAIELFLLVALTLAVAAVDVRTNSGARYAVCFVLASAMGIQTGIARCLAVADVNTTVATMTLHDLAAASRLAGGDSVRWRRRATVVAALFVGAAFGTLLDQVVRWGGFALAAALVGAVLAATVWLVSVASEGVAGGVSRR